MKAIVSVFAKDSKGITAYVTALLAQKEINILDISQTLMQEYFAMIMLVDLADCTTPFDQLSRFLQEKGAERCLDIHVQRQDIFEAMHRI
ncbi:MAG: ACT domain-containing protein [Firmicutes bacterium]|nr:ACT domain-containing protein [Bacillota bacterium]